MAKQIEGVYEKVLECAKAEFLEKGFKEASLRTIASNAGTSTGSIYTRFGDKSGLFEALVNPVVAELKTWFTNMQDAFSQMDGQTQREEYSSYGMENIGTFIDYIYDHYDIFKLLLACSEGTVFSDFVHQFVEIDVKYTTRFIESIGNDALSSGRITTDFMHMLSSGFYSGFFEIILHDMDKESALVYIERLSRFYRIGWNDIFFGGDEPA